MPAKRTNEKKVMIRSFWISNSADMYLRKYMIDRKIVNKQEAAADIIEIACSGNTKRLK